MKAENWFQLRIVGVTIMKPGFGRGNGSKFRPKLRNRGGTVRHGEVALPESFRPCDRPVTATVTTGHTSLSPSENLRRFWLAHVLLTPWACVGS